MKHAHKAPFRFACGVALFIFSFQVLGQDALAYTQVSEYLCEIGIKFYRQGRYEEALHEFRKALISEPNFEPALKYIRLIEQNTLPAATAEEKIPLSLRIEQAVPSKEAISTYKETIKEYIDLAQPKKELPVVPLQVGLPEAVPPGTVSLPVQPTHIKLPKKEEVPYQPLTIVLDENFKDVRQPIEIEEDRDLLVVGKNIRRFLVTQPDILSVEKENPDQLRITGTQVGYTYVHIWDDNGRWTLEFFGSLPKSTGLTVAEKMRLDAERADTFKVRYILGWNSYETGRRADSLNRQSYSWYHSVSVNGATPYGKIDSTAVVRSLRETTDLTHFTLGLSEGSWGDFKDFSLRGFNFSPGFSNLALSGDVPSLRGVSAKSSAFNKKLYYNLFWGREGGGRFGNLSPGLTKIKNSFLNGADIRYYPHDALDFGFSVVHGYGRERPGYLNHYAYDVNANWALGDWRMGYEIGHDTETFAHLFRGSYHQPDLNFTYELRNIDKDYLTITGETWRRGELGGLFTLRFSPTEKWNISNRLDVYQDRLFPALDNDNRWNQNYDLDARYEIDPSASLRFAYTLQNQLGELSQSRYQSPQVGINKTFHFIRNIGTYLTYRHQDNKNYSGSSLDYMNDNISSGIRFSLIGNLYYFFNQQWNWLQDKYTGEHSRPHVYDTGLDFTSQVFDSPFYQNVRFMYRDEEDTASNLSFLSGQDYIEGYTELSYRPTPDKEAYCSARVRNVWAEKPSVVKRLEADFNAGMRYTWDTGKRWEAVGSIDGYVFKDLNSDGLRQRDEAPVEGVRLWLGKDISAVSDMFGYFKFSTIKGQKAFVVMDANTIPVGYVLTTPQTQAAGISQGRTTSLYFGLVSRSEISGIVYFDVDGDGTYTSMDKGIKNVVLRLDDSKTAKTDAEGRYSFTNISIGEHTLALDINSLPLDYLPQVPLVKTIGLFENITYLYNIPLKKIKE